MKINLMQTKGRLRANHQTTDGDFDYRDITDWFHGEPVVMPDVISMGSTVAIRGDLLGYTPALLETDYYVASVGSAFSK
jgi:hypothetical protein